MQIQTQQIYCILSCLGIYTILHAYYILQFIVFLPWHYASKQGGGQLAHWIENQKVTFLESNVGLTSNQAVNLGFSIVKRSIKKMFDMDLEGTMEGLSFGKVPQNQPCRIHFRVHLGVHEGPRGSHCAYYNTRISKNKMYDVKDVLQGWKKWQNYKVQL